MNLCSIWFLHLFSCHKCSHFSNLRFLNRNVFSQETVNFCVQLQKPFGHFRFFFLDFVQFFCANLFFKACDSIPSCFYLFSSIFWFAHWTHESRDFVNDSFVVGSLIRFLCLKYPSVIFVCSYSVSSVSLLRLNPFRLLSEFLAYVPSFMSPLNGLFNDWVIGSRIDLLTSKGLKPRLYIET